MGKRVEKALKSGAPTSASTRADDSSTPEPYTCTGNFSDDFNELWLRAGHDKDSAPLIKARAKRPDPPVIEDEGAEESNEKSDVPTTFTVVDSTSYYRPSIQVEFDVEDTKQARINHAKELYIRSWRVEEKILTVLKQCQLDRLNCINLWNVGLTEFAFSSFASMLPSLPCVKTLVLDGNPLPETEPYHLLIEDTPLQHLSLRNNRITAKGCLALGKALGDLKTQNRNLTALNLSYNRIDDEGAKHLAQGLRMNRSLMTLSLASNQIGDEGCLAVVGSLEKFPLTHEEVVHRRMLSSKQGYYGRGSSALGAMRSQSNDRPSSNRSNSQMTSRTNRGSSKKKTDNKKEEKSSKKDGKKGASVSDSPTKTKGKKSGNPGSKDAKRGGGQSTTMELEVPETTEFVHPLLDSQAEHTDGKVFLPGNMAVVVLNLSRNKIGVTGLESVLHAVQYQATMQRTRLITPTAPGLMKIFIQRNSFSEEHSAYVKLQELMVPRDPMYKPESKSPDVDMQSVAS